jgi:hypothetical protein
VRFHQTSEPRPGRVKVREQKLSYLIRKHDATRLHYGLRLELDGILLSWAVTKGQASIPPTSGWPFARKIILSHMGASREPALRANMAAPP